MSLGYDLNSEVGKILRESWTTRQGRVVPDPDDLRLGNDAMLLDGTVLYADLNGSTNLVETEKSEFAAEVYKCFLTCAARIIRAEGGVITAYDGDRIMAVYLGDAKNSDAARTALKINYSVNKIINPAIKAQYPWTSYAIAHVVGIDTSNLFVARIGVRGDNDLVWVGRSANYAAKLSDGSGPPSQITADVYNGLNSALKFSQDGQNMWIQDAASILGYKTIYTSTWLWPI
jgi:class 3 adenylate cyclase